MESTISEYVQYQFSNPELLELARTSARTQSEKRAFENQKAQVTKQLAGEIAARDTELQKLSELISNGYEYRMVDCHVVMDSPDRGMATICRADTGEVVRTRRMTSDETQMQLDLGAPEVVPCSISHNGEEIWSGTTQDIQDALKGRGL